MFAELVRTHRGRLGLTQNELAERAGVAVRTIRTIETGEVRVPRPPTVRLLADAFGLSGRGRDEFCAAAVQRVREVPRQLPAATPAYVGRRDALAVLDDLLTDLSTPRLAVVQGTAGVGKSTLALHWAHRVASHFPHGQLYLDLRGYGPSAPVHPSAATHRLLEGLDVSPTRIPAGEEARTALLRSTVAGRRILLVLDNARDAGQVRPLLPGSPGSVTVVTSRADHSGLATTAAARLVPLDLFGDQEALDLLAYHLGAERVAADSAAAGEIIARCAKLPLAIAIIAGRGAARTHFPLSSLACGPRPESVLDELTGSDVAADFRTVVSWSYHLLGESEARLFRLLGEVPGPDAGAAAAASLVGAAARMAGRDLAALASAHLAHEHVPGRFQLHGLLRSYARELSAELEPESSRGEAQRRLVDHYLHSAYAAGRLLFPRLARVELPAPRPGVTPERPRDSRAAFAWFIGEYPSLVEILELARTLGLHTETWQLTCVLGSFLSRRGRWQDAIALHEAALATATGPLAQRHLHHWIGQIAECHFQFPAAVRHLELALELARRLKDDGGVADILMDLSIVISNGGLPGGDEQALGYAEKALAHYKEYDESHNAACALNSLGWYLTRFGDPGRALGYCAEALRILATLPDEGPVCDPDLKGATLDTQAAAHSLLGHHREAIELQRAALRAWDRQGSAINPIMRAHGLAGLARIYRAAGQVEQAGAEQRRATQAYAELDIDQSLQGGVH